MFGRWRGERRALRGRPSLLVSFGPRLFLAANMSIVLETMGRVVDYMRIQIHGDRVPVQMLAVESAAPLWLWSAALTLGCVLVVIGSLDPPRLLALAGGHFVLFVTKMMIAVGGIVQILGDDMPGGWRIATTLLFGAAAMSALFGIATVQRRRALLDLEEQRIVGARA